MSPTPPSRRGALVLVPNTLDLGALAPGAAEPDLQQVLPLGAIDAAATLTHWVCENAKTTRAFLKRVNAIVPLVQPLQALHIRELPRAPKGGAKLVVTPDLRPLLQPALDQGQDIGLLSEAGLPAVADPGADLVAAAHKAGIEVRPLSGPSSIVLAVAASGLNGQSFAFVGYLPQDEAGRAARIRTLEARSLSERQTQLAIETPYRNEALMAALLAHLRPTTRLSVACGLTLEGGWNRSLSVAEWRQSPPQFAKNLPAVFGWLAAG
ncbi:SAM-dependent methyltransferase [Rivibacter subsaxonicus]|uniref:16S rRNA (Cytidine1402-2'-O)-methyltransferase n=1 Tax=Rivibacter subsaxonicus TaxID=457575 RepID=A0A4Q7VGU0_9BURK|nr:SAM-dependent methyltransferase [Rivibacter subsaxonicus]RZT95259.1 16S rRNA (cytidine1402-2'-O)-methyltransferase [Rivibacter subsaxonicus]